MGNKWSRVAEHLPGRTDNEIKNYWRTRMQKQERQRLKFDDNNMATLFPDHAMGCFEPRTATDNQLVVMGNQNCSTSHGGQARINNTANCISSSPSLVPNSKISNSTLVDTSGHLSIQTTSSGYTTATGITAAKHNSDNYSFPKALDCNF
ncbi:hypothetical protein MKX01_034807 [Papaver californicum]|nr:hypothetical protein MKX01_034807 [Papaver californicum]